MFEQLLNELIENKSYETIKIDSNWSRKKYNEFIQSIGQNVEWVRNPDYQFESYTCFKYSGHEFILIEHHFKGFFSIIENHIKLDLDRIRVHRNVNRYEITYYDEMARVYLYDERGYISCEIPYDALDVTGYLIDNYNNFFSIDIESN